MNKPVRNIPGEDQESRIRYNTLGSCFHGNEIEVLYGLSPQCTCEIDGGTSACSPTHSSNVDFHI